MRPIVPVAPVTRMVMEVLRSWMADGREPPIEPGWRPVTHVDMLIEPAGAVSRSRQRTAF
ncbi:hypothetical protein GCM10023334_067140 [Nonomuraea thailandensis]